MADYTSNRLNYCDDYNEDEIPIARSVKRWSYSEGSETAAVKQLREDRKKGLLIKMDSLKKLKSDSSKRLNNNNVATAGMFRDRKASFSSRESFPEDIAGIGPMTHEDMRKAMDMVPEKKIISHGNKQKVYVYVESAVTGKFLKYAMSIDGGRIDDNEDHSDHYHCCVLCPTSETREQAINKFELVMKITSTFLSGLVAGYSVEILYEVILNNEAKDFAIHYANRANEVRRFYFIVDTICFSMSLFQYQLNKKGATNMLPVLKDVRFLCAMLCYLVCLVLSLVASFIEDDLFQLEKQKNYEETIDGENWYTVAKYLGEKELDTRVSRLQVLCIFRGALCIISWIIHCRDVLDEFSRLQRANTMMKRIEGLSES